MEAESTSVPLLGETHFEKDNTSNVVSASLQDAETVKNTHNTNNSQSEVKVSSGDSLKSLFTDDFCHVCGAVLQFESQRVSHYEGKKHTQKVRLYLQTKRDEERMNSELTVFQQKDGTVDRERFCELCNMVFSAPVVAKSHYEGKVHAKNLRKLGMHPPQPAAQQTGDAAPPGSPLALSPQEEGEKEADKEKEEENMTNEAPVPSAQGVDLSDPNKYCRLCVASFNNPLMAKQHYNGRKHQRNQARFRLLQELEEDGQPGTHLASGTFTCPVCNVTLNSVEMYQAHMKGNKHQQKEMKVADLICQSQKKVYSSFQDELADYIQVQKARGLEPKTWQATDQEKEDEDEFEEEEEGKSGERRESFSGSAGIQQGEAAVTTTAPPPPWCPMFPIPPLHPSFGPRGPEGPPWRHNFLPVAPHFTPGIMPPGLRSWSHTSEAGGAYGRGRERLRRQESSRDRSSSSSSSITSYSSSQSSSSSSQSRRERRRKRRRKERGMRAKDEDSEEEEDKRGRGSKKRQKSRRHEEGRREERHRHKRRREGGVEVAEALGKEERIQEKEQPIVDTAEKMKGEKGYGREGKSKHRKEKKRKERTDKADTRTEEEKLWDESILGLL
ncbi:hypothetical protein AGOR_G00007780 [Albula goreensis]|uniref:Lysine-rich coiled-coil protein 1 n=1 Tax=Albula goreensis TaxID=1534307 RepID=A0A8T3E5C5_9TELE|nr:hypothetical protein AGOR_G00007780 [Albula goreensis]